MVNKFDDMINRYDTMPACDRKPTEKRIDGQPDILRQYNPRYA